MAFPEIEDALLRGDAERRRGPSSLPVTFPGMAFWAHATAYLRDAKRPEGWTEGRVGGLEAVVHPGNALQIVVATGSLRTGDPDPAANPTTKYTKGNAARKAVEQNGRAQLTLLTPGEVEASIPRRAVRANPYTYYLLARVDGAVIRSELSLPMHMLNKRPCTWVKRIILPEIDRGLEPTAQRTAPKSPTNMPTVVVERKSA